MGFPECLLQRVHLITFGAISVGKTLNRNQVLSIDLNGKEKAGADRHSLQ
jgi:hypothetical protein